MEHVVAEHGDSERIACRVLCQHRSTQRKKPTKPDDEAALTANITALAIQAKLAEGASKRMAARAESPAILMGLIFDDRGNPMSPSHSNKKGVRYRYYISHALLQNRGEAVGSIARVSAPDVETAVIGAIHNTCAADPAKTDAEPIETYIARVTVHPDRLAVQLRSGSPVDEGDGDPSAEKTVTVPFSPTKPLQKGVARAPSDPGTIDSETRDTLLQAIARARSWMDRIVSGKADSTDEIAASEQLAERYVRFLLPLAFLSPRIVSAIDNGMAPGDLTVATLARALPHTWAEQERRILRA